MGYGTVQVHERHINTIGYAKHDMESEKNEGMPSEKARSIWKDSVEKGKKIRPWDGRLLC